MCWKGHFPHQLTGCPTHKSRRKPIPEEKRFLLFAVVFPDCAGSAQTAGRYCPLMTLLLTNKLNFNGIFWQQHRWARRRRRLPDIPKHNKKKRLTWNTGCRDTQRSSLEEAQWARPLPLALTGLLRSGKTELKIETRNVVVLLLVSCICNYCLVLPDITICVRATQCCSGSSWWTPAAPTVTLSTGEAV